jgi:hypothetical protein
MKQRKPAAVDRDVGRRDVRRFVRQQETAVMPTTSGRQTRRAGISASVSRRAASGSGRPLK